MEVNWEQEINALDVENLSEKGLDSPELESLHPGYPSLDGLGDYSKLTTEVYFYVDKKSGKTYTMQKHWLTEYGEVSLREVLLHIKKKRSERS